MCNILSSILLHDCQVGLSVYEKIQERREARFLVRGKPLRGVASRLHEATEELLLLCTEMLSETLPCWLSLSQQPLTLGSLISRGESSQFSLYPDQWLGATHHLQPFSWDLRANLMLVICWEAPNLILLSFWPGSPHDNQQGLKIREQILGFTVKHRTLKPIIFTLSLVKFESIRPSMIFSLPFTNSTAAAACRRVRCSNKTPVHTA